MNRADAALDAVQGLMGATFSSGRIALGPAVGPLRFLFGAGGRTVVLTASPRLEQALENVAEGARDAFDVEERRDR